MCVRAAQAAGGAAPGSSHAAWRPRRAPRGSHVVRRERGRERGRGRSSASRSHAAPQGGQPHPRPHREWRGGAAAEPVRGGGRPRQGPGNGGSGECGAVGAGIHPGLPQSFSSGSSLSPAGIKPSQPQAEQWGLRRRELAGTERLEMVCEISLRHLLSEKLASIKGNAVQAGVRVFGLGFLN